MQHLEPSGGPGMTASAAVRCLPYVWSDGGRQVRAL
jgi:hypothetical protein